MTNAELSAKLKKLNMGRRELAELLNVAYRTVIDYANKPIVPSHVEVVINLLEEVNELKNRVKKYEELFAIFNEKKRELDI